MEIFLFLFTILMTAQLDHSLPGFETIGCFKDTSNRAIQSLEGKDSILDGSYGARKNAIAKCAVAAMIKGYKMFAVQHGGWCAASATADQTFDKYGTSAACGSDGEGGPWANQVYVIKGFETIGCFKDTSNRAIQSLEGKDSILDGSYGARKNAIAKCAVAAMIKGYKMFAVQHGGWCAASATADQTFDKYGTSAACGSDGEGGPWANQVYVIKGFETIGCFKDTSNRAIQSLEGKDSILDGSYGVRKNAIAKCAVAAMRKGYKMFAVQHGGWCAASATADQTFDKYGTSAACESDGEGGPWANQVYIIKGFETIGCFKDTSNRAIQSLEGKDSILDGSYRVRKNAIAKCAVAAMRKGYKMFAVQHGGWCAGSATADQTFDKYGTSAACDSDGEGGPWANQVYVIKGFETIGCFKDTSNRAIQSLEGKDSILDGSYRVRKNAIAKCAVAAMRKGYKTFAVQHGGWCAGSATADQTFDKYGTSAACDSDGEGGSWANQVYVIKGFETIGCFKDTSNRAIQSLEGKDSILDGSYRVRKNAIAKCAVAAMRKGYKTFAVQHGGWCAGSATADQTFDKYGTSAACDSDGEGGSWANQVYVIKGFETIGCFKDTSNRAIQSLEGKDSILDGSYRVRKNAIAKCAVAAMRKGYKTFAVQHGGWCAGSATADQTFDKYGTSAACDSDGEGGPWANQVYVIKGFETIGCFKDTSNRAIQSLEGKDSILDGSYRVRKNAIAKCAVAAMRKGYKTFAVQHGGWCAGSATADQTFDKYGTSAACDSDGEGGPWANQVYVIKGFETIGCFKDTSNRAIQSLEGKDSILDGSYRVRKNAIAKCAVAAMRKGYKTFAVQHGGWCAGSATADQTFDKYGTSTACDSDGEGGPWANQVYVIKGFETIGCFKDTSNRAIQSLEGKDSILDGSYRVRKNAIAKCAVAAMRKGYKMFAVQHGGWCAGSATADQTFDKYGTSTACDSDGEGGPWANQVYVIKGFETIGCFKDTSNRAIQSLEGKDSILDGSYRVRKNAIAKCAVAAMRKGYKMFAVQHGGWCAASATADQTFDKYGTSAACDSDGEGGPWANQVYIIKECQQPLGMEFGAIKDTQIRASSEWDLNHAAIQGRLNFQKSGIKQGAWSSRNNDKNQWLQIDLRQSYTKVTAVASQGRNQASQWVTKYKLQYSNDGVTFRYYKEQGRTVDKEFIANTDRDTIISHILNPPIMARYIRFRPVTWHNHISMRVEVYGCKQDMNECSPNPCQNGATCVDLVGSYRCNCKPGYTGNNCQTDINECSPNPCQNGATCVDLVGSYRCGCKPGYTGNNCQTDINECSPNPCQNGATCVDLVGGHRCDCVQGYSGSSCETNTNDCSPNPCQNGATCVDLVGGHRCDCAQGYTGSSCETNINECSPNPCHNGATCVDLIGGHRCDCAQGYSGSSCETNINDCSPNPCQNGATCVDLVGGHRCDCAQGYTGSSCETNINECSPNPCQNGATCVDLVGGHRCDCAQGYTGSSCETNINECSPNPCQNGATCVDLVGGHRCDCAQGYTGSSCETNINECSPNPCQNGATCVDLIGGHRCDCARGYSGSSCETNLNDCAVNHCKNGATCVDLVGSYQCICSPGFIGVTCEEVEEDECEE
ncbi:uncharacterized protein [Montipora capricornis]|uniref:uncharacterized protein isoform X3 n=1 Tax=Montipora capricornis TaxID=246305 RepID=UPI0035F1799B